MEYILKKYKIKCFLNKNKLTYLKTQRNTTDHFSENDDNT